MSFSFSLEQVYLSKEFSRPAPSAVRIIGTMLDSAFAQPKVDRDLDGLLRRLDTRQAQ